MMIVYGIEINDLNQEYYVKIAEDAMDSLSLPGSFLVDWIPFREYFSP